MSTKRYKRNIHKGTRKNFINKLKTIYPSCKFDTGLEDFSLYNGIDTTYGEMQYEGIQELYQYVTKNYNNKINTFIDLGSGRGKLCMYMAAQPKIKNVLGIELVKERHNDAENLKSQLQYEYANKVILINKNIFDVDLELYTNKQIFIWFSNLCFNQTGVIDIFKKLQNTLPKDTIICCSKPPTEPIGTYLNTIKVSMSWCDDSNVYIYKL